MLCAHNRIILISITIVHRFLKFKFIFELDAIFAGKMSTFYVYEQVIELFNIHFYETNYKTKLFFLSLT